MEDYYPFVDYPVVEQVQVEGDNFETDCLDKLLQDGDFKNVNWMLGRMRPEPPKWLQSHRICERPVLHFLVGRANRGHVGERAELLRLVKYYMEAGYNIDKFEDEDEGEDYYPFGMDKRSALHEAVRCNDLNLVEVLIAFGADLELRDGFGRSAIQIAAMYDHRKMLELLLGQGARREPTEEELRGGKIHPLLHTVIDENADEVLEHLLTHDLVDINQPAVYHQPEEPPFENYTPMERAVKGGNCHAAKLLLKLDVDLDGFQELNYCLANGLFELAYLLLDRFSEEELRNHKIGEKWALHCLKPRTTEQSYLRGIIARYVQSGWDINVLSKHELTIELRRGTALNAGSISISNYSILHWAAFLGSQDLIKTVVEAGGDVNIFSGDQGDIQCSPLPIAILKEDFRAAECLLDLGADAQRHDGFYYKLEDPRRSIQFSALELILHLGLRGSETFLDKMLAKGLTWNGTQELESAVLGGKLELVTRVFECVREAAISSGALVWPTDDHHQKGSPIPVFTHLLENYKVDPANALLGPEWMADLLSAFVAQGYKTSFTEKGTDPMIFAVLGFSLTHDMENLFLKRFLLLPGVELNGRNREGLSPVAYFLHIWNYDCLNYQSCRKSASEGHNCCDVVKLLLRYGVDVSTMAIGEGTKFHWGYGPMVQALCASGASVKSEFWKSPLCNRGRGTTLAGIRREVEAIRGWVTSKGQRFHLNLQVLARSSIKNALWGRDAKELESLPPPLRRYVGTEEIRGLEWPILASLKD